MLVVCMYAPDGSKYYVHITHTHTHTHTHTLTHTGGMVRSPGELSSHATADVKVGPRGCTSLQLRPVPSTQLQQPTVHRP